MPIPAPHLGRGSGRQPRTPRTTSERSSESTGSASRCAGTGAYRFAEYRRGEFIRPGAERELLRALRATCKEWYLHIIKDDQARVARFWNNGLCVVIQLPMPEYRRLVLEGDEKRPLWEMEDRDKVPPAAWDFTYFLWRRPTYGGFGWNQRKPILSRQARAAAR